MIDLSIIKTDRPDPVFVGGRLTYTLTVRNLGPDTATNVRVADALPAATNFVSVATSQGTCTGGRIVRCSLGTMLNGGRATITIVVRPTEPGALLNTATVVGEQTEPNTANNRSTAPTLVRGPIAPPVASCPSMIVQPRSLSVGQRGLVRVVVVDKNRGVSGVRVLVKGPGLYKAATTNGRGRVAISVRPPRTGIVEIRMTNQPSRCSTRQDRCCRCLPSASGHGLASPPASRSRFSPSREKRGPRRHARRASLQRVTSSGRRSRYGRSRARRPRGRPC